MAVIDRENAVSEPVRIGDAVRERILGVAFFNGTPADAVERFRHIGGLLVSPASPGLLKLYYDEEYRRALQQADMALADSELLTLLWRFAGGRKLRKISGVSYLRYLLQNVAFKTDRVLCVVASESAKERALQWLRHKGFQVSEENFYVTSLREKTEDYELLLEIEKRNPRDVIIATVAGSQEKLGLYLRDYLHGETKPNIHCVGAALGFLTGDQPPISEWADRHNLGWLPRLLSQPRLCIPRLGIAFALVNMVLRHRSELPPLRRRWEL